MEIQGLNANEKTNSGILIFMVFHMIYWCKDIYQ